MDLQEEVKALKQRIAELERQAKEEKEFPKNGDDYWYVNDSATVAEMKWDGCDYEEERLSIGNVFRTEEQAKFVAEKIKVEAILRSYSRPFEKDTNNYFIELCSFDDSLTIDADADFQPQGTFYFDSEEIALQAIDKAGDWRIKRFIFGVEG